MIFAKQVKLPDGWAKSVRLTIAVDRITGIHAGQKPEIWMKFLPAH